MKEKFLIMVALMLVGSLAAYANWFYVEPKKPIKEEAKEIVELTLRWGDVGSKMVEAGVVDAEQLEELHVGRGEYGDREREMLRGNSDLIINKENAGFALNMLWAFGLSNKNDVLTKGPMMDPKYGDAGRFASTGGWTLASGDPMDHYSKHGFVELTAEQQELVERVSKNVYRPCCNNSTHFPDCNHGMAMLGLLELLARDGKSEKEMYEAALFVNELWFPADYEAIHKYFEMKNMEKDPKVMLSLEYSSSSGIKKVYSVVKPNPSEDGGGCGV